MALNATTTYMLLYPLHFAGSGSSLWPPKRIIDWGGAIDPKTRRKGKKGPVPAPGRGRRRHQQADDTVQGADVREPEAAALGPGRRRSGQSLGAGHE